MIADFHNILARWGIYFSQPFNEHSFIEVRQIEIPTPDNKNVSDMPLSLGWLLES